LDYPKLFRAMEGKITVINAISKSIAPNPVSAGGEAALLETNVMYLFAQILVTPIYLVSIQK